MNNTYKPTAQTQLMLPYGSGDALQQFKTSVGFAICGGGLLVTLSNLALWSAG